MRIKRIVGMAKNSCNSVIAELDNGLYAMVPTVQYDEEVDYKPSLSDYAYSYLVWNRWVPIIANGYVDPEYFPTARENFKKLFEEKPLDEETEKRFKEIRENQSWADNEKEAEEFCKKKYDASGFDFMKELNQMFSGDDPTGGE